MTHEILRACDGPGQRLYFIRQDVVDLLAEHDAVVAERDQLHDIINLNPATREAANASETPRDISLTNENQRLRDENEQLRSAHLEVKAERDQLREIIREHVPYPASPDSEHTNPSETPNSSPTCKETLQVDWSKPLQTADGRPVRLLYDCRDEHRALPMVVAVKFFNEEIVWQCDREGRCVAPMPVVINVPAEYEIWITAYFKNGKPCWHMIHISKEMAMANTKEQHCNCVQRFTLTEGRIDD